MIRNLYFPLFSPFFVFLNFRLFLTFCQHYTLFMVFTLLMNLHDFVAEPVNPVHSFHNTHTVPFCLSTDHISTCLMIFSARVKTAQFWSVLIRGEWKCSICSHQRRWCGVPARRTGTAERVWKPGSLHGVPWRAQFGYGTGGRHDSWQRMHWYAPSLSVSTAGNGCSGMPWTLDQVKYLFLSVDD